MKIRTLLIAFTLLTVACVLGTAAAGANPYLVKYAWSPCVYDNGYNPARYESASQYAYDGHPPVSTVNNIAGQSVHHYLSNPSEIFVDTIGSNGPSQCTSSHHLSFSEYIGMGSPAAETHYHFFEKLANNPAIYDRSTGGAVYYVSASTWALFGDPTPVVVASL